MAVKSLELGSALKNATEFNKYFWQSWLVQD